MRKAQCPLFACIIFAIVCCAVNADAAATRWIAVTTPELRPAIEPLCQWRRDQGFDVHLWTNGEFTDAESLQARIHAGDSATTTCVVLVGVEALAFKGRSGRMKDRPSDLPYACRASSDTCSIAVGRLPARTEVEARSMVDKILKFERETVPGIWDRRLSVIIGNPGGKTFAEKKLSEWFIGSVGRDCFARISPFWQIAPLIHVPGAPYYVPDDQLPEAVASSLQEGQVFSMYLGHSNPLGLSSNGVSFMNRNDWQQLRIQNRAGIFFTCACSACATGEADSEADAYGLIAMRNPNGPVAIIGATGVSYGAIGQLALDGLLTCLKRNQPPPRLGEYWLAVQNGIAHGSIDPFTFYLYDQADGTRGAVPLDRQRREHLEMWTLLGDPATRLPIPASICNSTLLLASSLARRL